MLRLTNTRPRCIWAGLFAILLASSVAQSQEAKINVPPETPTREIFAAAQQAEKAKNFLVAHSLYQEVIKREPRHPHAWHGLGKVKFSLERDEEAAECFRKQIELDAFHPSAYHHLGMAESRLGRSKEAEAAFLKQIEVSPLSAVTHASLGRFYLGEYKGGASRSTLKLAIETLETAGRLAPSDMSVRMLLGRAYVEAGEKAKGDALLAEAGAVMSDADKTAELNRQGAEAIGLKRFREAVGLLKQATEIDPRHPYAWNNLGRAYRGLGRDEEAMACYRKQIEINPADKYAYNNLGGLLRSQNKKVEAEAAFRKQLELDPDDVFANLNLGMLLVEAKRADEAIVVLEKAQRISPKEPAVRFSLASAYSLKGNKEKAAALLGDAKNSFPDMLSFSGNTDPMGAVFSKAKDPDESLKDTSEERTRLNDHLWLVSESDMDEEDAAVSNRVAALWAIRGEAQQRKGEVAVAEKLLLAAWMWTQSSAVADRLGELYEKQGLKLKAITYYRRALGSSPAHAQSREKLDRLAGGKVAAQRLVQANSGELSDFRTARLGPSARKGSGEYLLLFRIQGTTATVQAAQFVGGDAKVEKLEKVLAAAKYKLMAPEDKEVRMVRKAVVYCGGGSCMATLMPASPMEMISSRW